MFGIKDIERISSIVKSQYRKIGSLPCYPSRINMEVPTYQTWYETVLCEPEFPPELNWKKGHTLQALELFQQKAAKYDPQTGVLRPSPDKDTQLYAGFMVAVTLPEVKQMLRGKVLPMSTLFPSNLLVPGSGQYPIRINMLTTQEIKDVSIYIVNKLESHGMIQAASQTNALEMSNENLTPYNGIGIYTNDRTQGPAVALTSVPALHMRNYWVTETLGKQFNSLEDCGIPSKNGYFLWGNNPDRYVNMIDESKIKVPFSLYAQVVGIHSREYQGPFFYHHTKKLVHQAYTSSAPVNSYGNGGFYNAQLQIVHKILVAEYKILIAMTLLMWYYDRLAGRTTTRIPTVDLAFIGAGVFNNPANVVMAAMAEAIYEFQEYAVHYRIHAFTPTVQAAVQTYLSPMGFDKQRFKNNIAQVHTSIYGFDRPLGIFSPGPFSSSSLPPQSSASAVQPQTSSFISSAQPQSSASAVQPQTSSFIPSVQSSLPPQSSTSAVQSKVKYQPVWVTSGAGSKSDWMAEQTKTKTSQLTVPTFQPVQSIPSSQQTSTVQPAQTIAPSLTDLPSWMLPSSTPAFEAPTFQAPKSSVPDFQPPTFQAPKSSVPVSQPSSEMPLWMASSQPGTNMNISQSVQSTQVSQMPQFPIPIFQPVASSQPSTKLPQVTQQVQQTSLNQQERVRLWRPPTKRSQSPLSQDIRITEDVRGRAISPDPTPSYRSLRPEEDKFPGPEVLAIAVANEDDGSTYQFFKPLKYQEQMAQAAWGLNLGGKTIVTAKFSGKDNSGRPVSAIIFKQITPAGILVGYEAPPAHNLNPRMNYFVNMELVDNYGIRIVEEKKMTPRGLVTSYSFYTMTPIDSWPPVSLPRMWPRY